MIDTVCDEGFSSTDLIGGNEMRKRICFVMMPFGTGEEYTGKRRESNFILRNIIEPGVSQAVHEFRGIYPESEVFDLEVVRELENSAPGDITEAIVRHIANAYITVVDLTGRNPNVFFELGVRFALKRNGTILLVQDGEEVPFNIKTYRTVVYDPLYDGPQKATQALKAATLRTIEALEGLTPAATTTDSLVFQALPDLSIAGSGLVEEIPLTDQVGWEEYWRRIVHITDELSELRAVGAYEPHILVGISNGGLLLADTVLRLVFANSKPLICLWAFRTQEKYFENPVNDGLVAPEIIRALVKGKVKSSEPIRVLVMDDIVGTQRTFKQLVDYFEERLGDMFKHIELRFVFIYTPREETLDDLAEYLLSEDRTVARRHRRVDIETITRKRELPYRKSIHYGDVVREQRRATSISEPSFPVDHPSEPIQEQETEVPSDEKHTSDEP